MTFKGAIFTVCTLGGFIAIAIALFLGVGSGTTGGDHSAPVHRTVHASQPVTHAPRVQVTPAPPSPSQSHTAPPQKQAPHHRAATTPTVRHITVKPGDTLWSLSHSNASHPLRWVQLWHHNMSVIGHNPALIHPGEVLTL